MSEVPRGSGGVRMEEHGINERKQKKRGEKRRGIKREECDIKAEREMDRV